MTDYSFIAANGGNIDMAYDNYVCVKWDNDGWKFCDEITGNVFPGVPYPYCGGLLDAGYVILGYCDTYNGLAFNTSIHPDSYYYQGNINPIEPQYLHEPFSSTTMSSKIGVYKIVSQPVIQQVTSFDAFFTSYEINPLCYSGLSMVETKSCLKPASDVKKGDYVLSSTRGFVEVLDNIVTYNAKEYYLFKKGCFGETPTEDFYATGGHPIFLNGTEILAKDIPEGERIIVENETVYSIATSEREYIKINGLDVCTWNYNDWITNDLSKKILWDSN